MAATARPVHDAMRAKLIESLSPAALRIIDESAAHAEHIPGRTGETHFRVEIAADAFAGLGLVKRHQLVHKALDEELKDLVHAITIWSKTPAEAGADFVDSHGL